MFIFLSSSNLHFSLSCYTSSYCGFMSRSGILPLPTPYLCELSLIKGFHYVILETILKSIKIFKRDFFLVGVPILGIKTFHASVDSPEDLVEKKNILIY